MKELNVGDKIVIIKADGGALSYYPVGTIGTIVKIRDKANKTPLSLNYLVRIGKVELWYKESAIALLEEKQSSIAL